jgi:hypothetical protein
MTRKDRSGEGAKSIVNGPMRAAQDGDQLLKDIQPHRPLTPLGQRGYRLQLNRPSQKSLKGSRRKP